MVKLVACSLNGRSSRIYGTIYHVPEQHARATKFDLIAIDAGDVKEVVDQAYHVPKLPVHHGTSLGDGARISGGKSNNLQTIAQRGQRIPQFMCQEREELVLAPVLLSQGVLHATPLGDIGPREAATNRTTLPDSPVTGARMRSTIRSALASATK